MSVSRLCSRAACSLPATATLTYVYADSTAVLGPLATYAEPHAYDLCTDHAARLTAPRGWDVVRLDSGAPAPDSHDDLVAIAEAVRRRPGAAPSSRGPVAASVPATASAPATARPTSQASEQASGLRETGRRGHLRVLRDQG